ncbi:hypothetical protein GW17_00002578 [Ensete ventricosum]|nr:hypothetical protein GW17_00002578 [Ensete ventricosum]
MGEYSVGSNHGSWMVGAVNRDSSSRPVKPFPSKRDGYLMARLLSQVTGAVRIADLNSLKSRGGVGEARPE